MDENMPQNVFFEPNKVPPGYFLLLTIKKLLSQSSNEHLKSFCTLKDVVLTITLRNIFGLMFKLNKMNWISNRPTLISLLDSVLHFSFLTQT